MQTVRDIGPVEELGGNVERFAGEEIKSRVMEGGERIASLSSEEVAKWVKGAMEMLDSLVDEETRVRIKAACGHKCANINSRPIEMAKRRRENFDSEDEFLEAEIGKPMRGTGLAREGETLYYTYTP